MFDYTTLLIRYTHNGDDTHKNQTDTINNTTRSFLIDVIIRNQDVKKLETTRFGLTLAIFRFHLEKLFCEIVIQNTKKIKIADS